MTKDQLKTLSTLPAVIEALEAFCSEAEQLRALLARAGMTAPRTPAPRADPRFAPVAPGHAALATPEREEFNADRNAPFVEETPQQARQRAMMERIKGDPLREERLAQFKKDGDPNETVAQ